MKTYAGIDLHSSNNYIGIIDENDKRLYQKRLQNQLVHIKQALEPFRDSLQAVVVESTYNWYWMVDGLKEDGYKLYLANPSECKGGQVLNLERSSLFISLSAFIITFLFFATVVAAAYPFGLSGDSDQRILRYDYLNIDILAEGLSAGI